MVEPGNYQSTNIFIIPNPSPPKNADFVYNIREIFKNYCYSLNQLCYTLPQ